MSEVNYMESDKQNGQQKAVAVYLSFKTFQSAVQSLRTHGLPGTLDRTAFGSRSGAEQTQILSAFKFLGLIDDASRAQESLKALVKVAENSTEEKSFLATLLKERYANAFALNLEAATPAQLDKAIGDYGAGGSTKDRAVRFFIKAAEHAGFKLSQRLTARKPRSASTPAGNGDDTDSKKRKGQSHDPNTTLPPSSGSQLKTVSLPGVGGTLSVSGTFNFFDLVGDERELVLGIIDLINAFAQKSVAAK
jgi:hypothetical protein